jgi:hypothetical protein
MCGYDFREGHRCTCPWICRTCSRQRRACGERLAIGETLPRGRLEPLVKALRAAYFFKGTAEPRLPNISVPAQDLRLELRNETRLVESISTGELLWDRNTGQPSDSRRRKLPMRYARILSVGAGCDRRPCMERGRGAPGSLLFCDERTGVPSGDSERRPITRIPALVYYAAQFLLAHARPVASSRILQYWEGPS